MYRPVEILVNGKRLTYTVGTSADEVFKDSNIEIKPGNKVSVSRKLLEEGKGQEFSLKVNNKPLDYESAQKYKISSGDELVFADGKDVMEDHSFVEKEVQPKLVLDGDYGSVSYVSQWGKPGKYKVLTGKESGETVDGDWIQKPQDCVIRITNIHPKDGKKIVALTFDDGPSQYTQQVLDILAKYGIKATFCQVGNEAEQNPKTAKAVLDAGMQIISHSTRHAMLTADGISFDEEVGKSLKQIEKATGVKTTALRPPYGAFNQKTWLASKGMITTSFLWTQDSRDWSLPGASSIVANSCSNITPGSIVLLHDGGGNRTQTVEALPKIIENLKNEGYEFVTLSELMKSDPSIPESMTTCNVSMPEGCVWPDEIGINW